MNTTEPHDDLDARLTAALHRRAADVHLAPRGLGDVRRRVHRRRRRAATIGAAAVAVPALAGIGWLAARPAASSTAPAAGPDGPVVDAPTTSFADQAAWRCTGQTGADEQYSYFDDCEPVGTSGATVSTVIGTVGGTTPIDGTTTTLPVPAGSWPPLTTIAAGWVGTILIVDATGEADPPALSPVESLESTLWAPSYLVSLLVADRTSPETMVMPVATDDDSQANASILAAYLGVGGFDTWSAIDWTADAVPDDIAFVVVLGQDWREHPSIGGAMLPPAASTTTDLP